jgi:hypothetical protein
MIMLIKPKGSGFLDRASCTSFTEVVLTSLDCMFNSRLL